MIPALLILALWVALLAPGVIRWVRHHTPSTSIASFHRQLRGLEHTGPKLMEPAYRLEGDDEPLTEWEAPPPPTPAPRLVLLTSGSPTKESTTMRHEDRYDDRYRDPYGDPLDDAYPADDEGWDDAWGAEAAPHEPARSARTVRTPRYDDYEDYDDDGFDAPVARPLTPARARTRRTRILAGLGAAIVGSFVLGLLPGMTILWAVTLVAVLAMIAYLALMLYASSAGLYGSDALAKVTPVARSVVTPYPQGRHGRYDDDWADERLAAAR